VNYRFMFFVATISITSSMAIAADNEGQFHCPKPGTKFENSLGRKWVALQENGPLSCAYRGSKGDYKIISHVTINTRYNPNNVLSGLWPLKTGNRVDFTTNAGNTTSTQHLEVMNRETVVVKAGSFTVFAIKWVSEGGKRRQSHIENVYYYAPLLGDIVKYTFKAEASSEYFPDWELTKIEAP